MIEICNLQKLKAENIYDIKIDKTTKIGRILLMNDEDIENDGYEEYHKYFYNQMKENSEFKSAIDQLIDIYNKYGKLRLFTWWTTKRRQCIKTIYEYIVHSDRTYEDWKLKSIILQHAESMEIHDLRLVLNELDLLLDRKIYEEEAIEEPILECENKSLKENERCYSNELFNL